MLSFLKRTANLSAAQLRTVPIVKAQSRAFHLHEYQSHNLLKKFGIRCVDGEAVSTVEEARQVAAKLGSDDMVVKAQILAGGRGKGYFTNGLRGGVHTCQTVEEAVNYSQKMLGQTLVTAQTGPKGRVVDKVFIAKRLYVRKEFYFAILLDRQSAAPVMLASSSGGVDIESIAKEDPSAIIKERIDVLEGIKPHQTLQVAKKLGIMGTAAQEEASNEMLKMYKFFCQYDCTQLEINPFVLTSTGQVLALDAKLTFDSNAAFRQPEIVQLAKGQGIDDPREAKAAEYDLNFIGLDGNIGCLVNGAGLAMATMDMIQLAGGKPANFLDVGGGATEKMVSEALKILSSDANVQAVLINIFGGIMRCDVIALGILNAVKTLKLNLPLVVRLQGTNMKEAHKILENSGLRVIAANDLEDAAQKAVKVAQIVDMAKSAHLSVSFELPI